MLVVSRRLLSHIGSIDAVNDTLLSQESNGRPDSAEQTQREFSEVKIKLITHAVCHMCIKTGANCRQTLDKKEGLH